MTVGVNGLQNREWGKQVKRKWKNGERIIENMRERKIRFGKEKRKKE